MYLGILALAAGIAISDQAAKSVVRERLVSGGVVLVPGLLDFRYVHNTGAAWGLFAGRNGWLVVLSLVMLAAIVCSRAFMPISGTGQAVGVGLMVGGIAGNLLDRVRLGYVVDFIDFHAGSSHFPAFNIADSGICVGVGLYLLFGMLLARAQGSEPACLSSD